MMSLTALQFHLLLTAIPLLTPYDLGFASLIALILVFHASMFL